MGLIYAVDGRADGAIHVVGYGWGENAKYRCGVTIIAILFSRLSAANLTSQLHTHKAPSCGEIKMMSFSYQRPIYYRACEQPPLLMVSRSQTRLWQCDVLARCR